MIVFNKYYYFEDYCSYSMANCVENYHRVLDAKKGFDFFGGVDRPVAYQPLFLLRRLPDNDFIKKDALLRASP